MRERSILVLSAGSSSTSQAAPAKLNHNDTHRSHFFVLHNGGNWLPKAKRPLFFSRAAICIYYQWQNKGINIIAGKKKKHFLVVKHNTQKKQRWNKFYWSKCMAFIRGTNKALCLSHPLWQITVTAHANKEDGNVASARKNETEEQRERKRQ